MTSLINLMERPKPLISVIIPVYNVASYLVPCLESVCAQTYSNLEIVVVNDGSTDGSLAIVQDFAARDSRMVLVDKENGGLMSARRDGLFRSTGEFVFWLDGDDYISLDCVEKLYDAVASNGCDVASAQRVRVRQEYISADGFMVPGVKSNREFLDILLLHRHVTVGGKLYRRSLWTELSYCEDISLGEDFLLNLELALNPSMPSIVFVDDAFYFYVQRPGSMIRLKDSFPYLENFMKRIAEITDVSNDYGEGLKASVVAERALRLYVYIKKGRNEWYGDAPLCAEVRNEVCLYEKELRRMIPGVVVSSVKLYPKKRNKTLINLMGTVMRLRQSMRRRHLEFDPTGVMLPPSAKLPVRHKLKKRR